MATYVFDHFIRSLKEVAFTRDETKEQIRVMKHYADGGELEARPLFGASVCWEDCEKPSWNWQSFDYRIKKAGPVPEHLLPALVGIKLRSKKTRFVSLVTGWRENYVTFAGGARLFSEDLAANYEFWPSGRPVTEQGLREQVSS